jgi:hypothetical protein
VAGKFMGDRYHTVCPLLLYFHTLTGKRICKAGIIDPSLSAYAQSRPSDPHPPLALCKYYKSSEIAKTLNEQ